MTALRKSKKAAVKGVGQCHLVKPLRIPKKQCKPRGNALPDQQPADQSTGPSFPEGAEKQVDGTDILVVYLERVGEAADSEKEAVRICTTVCNTDGRLKPEKEVFLDGATLAMKEYYGSGQLLSNAEYYESSNVTYHEYTTSFHD